MKKTLFQVEKKATRAASDRLDSTLVRLSPPTTEIMFPERGKMLRLFLNFFLLKIVILVFGYFTPFSLAQEASPAQFSWNEKFENPEHSWRVLGGDKTVSLINQERSMEDAHSGTGSELLEVQFNDKAEIVFGHGVDFAWVINELAPSIWVKSEHPGITIGAQVVMSKAINPQTGRPITFLVAGEKYGQRLGQWERLGFENKGKDTLAGNIERTLRVLRRELGVELDSSEMYVRQVVLFVEGNRNQYNMPSRVKIWVDDLEVTGHVPLWPEKLRRLENTGFNGETTGKETYVFDPVNVPGFRLQASRNIILYPEARPGQYVTSDLWEKYSKSGNDPWYLGRSNEQFSRESHNRFARYAEHAGLDSGTDYIDPNLYGRGPFALASGPDFSFGQNSQFQKPSVRIASQQLHVDGDAIGVRAIEYRGEPLDFLLRLGFNTVWVAEPPSKDLLQESKRIGVRLICPPPSAAELRAAGIQVDGLPNTGMQHQQMQGGPIGNDYDNVLLWDLGSHCVYANHERIQEWASLVRAADAMIRPFVASPDSGIYEYSLIPNIILMMRREPLLGTLELKDFAEWQKGFQRLARPGTPVWSTVQTQPDPRIMAQWDLSGEGASHAAAVSFEQMQNLVRIAIANGSHGILFTSNSPLTNDDPETKYRACALELINLELMMIDEWFAKGRLSGVVESNKPEMSFVLIESNRSRLLLPTWNELGSQYVTGASSARDVVFRVPVPVTYDAKLLLPGGAPPLQTKQKAGGREVHLSEANLSSIVFMTQESNIAALMTRRTQMYGKRGAQLATQLAQHRLEAMESTLQVLEQAKESGAIPTLKLDRQALISLPEMHTLLDGARNDIQFCNLLIGSHDLSEAYLQAIRATEGLRLTQRKLWIEATRSDCNRSLFPVSTTFATIPNYISTFTRLSNATLGDNRLVAGDAENPDLWGTAGWRPFRHTMVGINADVSFSERAARSGQRGLRLRTSPENQDRPPVQVETAPFWISTHGMPVISGELLCINGWINVPKKIEGSVDGVMILDTLGGEPLALRFDDTGGWKEFTFYRHVPNDGDYRIFFLLTGIGEAYLDDISVRPVVWGTIPFPVPDVPGTQQPFWRAPLDRLNPIQYLPGSGE